MDVSHPPRKNMGAEDGKIGRDKLESVIKLIYSVASDILINQHANTDRNAHILLDTKLVEFITVQDQFLTPSVLLADLVLPACTQFET